MALRWGDSPLYRRTGTQTKNVSLVTQMNRTQNIFQKALARCKNFDIMEPCKQARGCKQAKALAAESSLTICLVLVLVRFSHSFITVAWF